MTDYLTTAQVADHLGVHYTTVARWCRAGILPASKPGHDWLIDPADLAAFTPPALGPKPAEGRQRLGEQATEMVEAHPELLYCAPGAFRHQAHELARQAGVNRERARQALAKAIRRDRAHR